MKKRIIIFSILAFMLSENLQAQTGKNRFNKKKMTIGFIGKIKTNPVFVAAYSGAKLAAKELGAKYDIEIVIEEDKLKRQENIDNFKSQSKEIFL